jgi:hypothetical protein
MTWPAACVARLCWRGAITRRSRTGFKLALTMHTCVPGGHANCGLATCNDCQTMNTNVKIITIRARSATTPAHSLHQASRERRGRRAGSGAEGDAKWTVMSTRTSISPVMHVRARFLLGLGLRGASAVEAGVL